MWSVPDVDVNKREGWPRRVHVTIIWSHSFFHIRWPRSTNEDCFFKVNVNFSDPLMAAKIIIISPFYIGILYYAFRIFFGTSQLVVTWLWLSFWFDSSIHGLNNYNTMTSLPATILFTKLLSVVTTRTKIRLESR